MESKDRLAELQRFLRNFSSDFEVFVKQVADGDVPEFRLPNWPNMPSEWIPITVKLGRKKFLFPAITQNNFLQLENRKLRVEFQINKEGVVFISCYRNFFEPANNRAKLELYISSYETRRHESMRCFIILHQFLNELCAGIISEITRKFTEYKREVEEYNRIVEAVQRSFEPLIPFVMADRLSE